ncbi:MAG: secreted lipase [Linnemannia gamsii]|nr:MAG: secreted lipase [Linnemannia gamsii]
MKFSITSVLSFASTAVLLALSAVPASALPTTPAAVQALQKRATKVEGLNNYSCKPKSGQRPVILVHATLLTLDSWSDFAPVLIKKGYCVFALTYGVNKAVGDFGGLNSIESSAQELGTFANNVLTKTNSKQVDIVGHSQGGILARYWIKYLDGKGKVYRHVGVSPINHGTTLSSIVTVAKLFGIFYPSQSLFDKFAPSFYQMVNTSEFIKKLNAGGDFAPGVIHSNIATKFDEVVTPYETCWQQQPNITNVLLQDFCLLSLNEHLTMVNSKVVLQFVLNQLDPSTAKTANCLSMFS